MFRFANAARRRSGPVGALRWVVVVAAGALALASTAAAQAPINFRVPFDETEVEDWSLATCGFEITAHLAGTATVQLIRDADGTTTRIQIHVNATGTFSANGLSLAQATDDNRVIDLVKATETDVGIPIRLSIPRAGVLTLDVGRLVFNADGNLAFEAGSHPGLHGESGGEICAALTP
jgi:hypothetical protein